jgi:mersacidin/lichenicidin family type 2 lantibiotic
MSPLDIIRAWKDEEYRRSLSEAKRALLPAHPAGFIELTDTELDVAAGGLRPAPTAIRITCNAQCQSMRPLTNFTNCCYA